MFWSKSFKLQNVRLQQKKCEIFSNSLNSSMKWVLNEQQPQVTITATTLLIIDSRFMRIQNPTFLEPCSPTTEDP